MGVFEPSKLKPSAGMPFALDPFAATEAIKEPTRAALFYLGFQEPARRRRRRRRLA